MGMENLNAIVTGAAKGIGRSIAFAMAARGANLALCDINPERLDETAAEIGKAHPVRVLTRKVDVSSGRDVAEFARFAEDELKCVDILVNNAGIYILHTIDETDEEEWDRVMAVNLKSCFLFCKAILPGMRRRKFGRIVNMSSAAGKSGGTICGAHYAASKGGILAFTRHLAKQVGEEGITVNAVAPSSIAADMMLNLSPEGLAKAAGATVVKRLGTTEEVAEAVCYLADRNAGFTTGETLSINGGCIMD